MKVAGILACFLMGVAGICAMGQTAAEIGLHGNEQSAPLLSISNAQDRVELRSFGSSGWNYLLDQRSELSSGVWERVETTVGADSEFCLTNQTNSRSGFYRLEAVKGGDVPVPSWYAANRIHHHWEGSLNNYDDKGGYDPWKKWITGVYQQIIDGGARAVVGMARHNGEGAWWQSSVGDIHPGTVGRDLFSEVPIYSYHSSGVHFIGYHRHDIDFALQDSHPEWLYRDVSGDPVVCDRGSASGETLYQMCMNSPFRDFMKTRLVEATERHADGFYFDQTHMPEVCFCDNCKAAYFQLYDESMPVNPDAGTMDYLKVARFVGLTIRETFEEWAAAVHAVDPRVVMVVCSRYSEFRGNLHHDEEFSRSNVLIKTEYPKRFGQTLNKAAPYYRPKTDLQEAVALMISRDITGGSPPHVWTNLEDPDSEGALQHSAARTVAYGGIAGMSPMVRSQYIATYQKMFSLGDRLTSFMIDARPYAWALIHVSNELKETLYLQDAGYGDAMYQELYAPVLGAAQALRDAYYPFATLSDGMLKDGELPPECRVLIADYEACSDRLRAAIDSVVSEKGLTLIDLNDDNTSLKWYLEEDQATLRQQLIDTAVDSVGLPAIYARPPASGAVVGMSVCYHINRATGGIMAAAVQNWYAFSISAKPSNWIARVPFAGVELVCSRNVPSLAVASDFAGSQVLSVVPDVFGGAVVALPNFDICSFVVLSDGAVE